MDVLLGLFIFNRRARSRILKFLMFGAGEIAEKLRMKEMLKGLEARIKGNEPNRAA